MAEKLTIEVEADVKGAVDDIGKIEKGVKDIGKTAKAQKSAVKSIETGFKGVGLAMKAAGFGIILKIVDGVTNALMQNQAIADTVSTAFNVIGLVVNKIVTVFQNVTNRVGESSGNFDALGRIISNITTLALGPLKIAFYLVLNAIRSVQLMWEKSMFGGQDLDKIEDLTKKIHETRGSIVQTGKDMANAAIGIVQDFTEGVGEIIHIAEVVVDEFSNEFENVTVNSLVSTAKAITKATNNLSLLQEKHARIIIQFEKDAEVQRAIRDDISKSIDERLEANKNLLSIAEEQAEAEIKALKDQKGAVAAQLKLDKDNAEIKAQLYALETAIIETEKRKTTLVKESTEQENALLDERKANMIELNKIGLDAIAERQNAIDVEEEARKELARRTISDAEELAAKMLDIEEDAQKKRDVIKQEEVAKEAAIQESKRQIISGALTGLTALIGEETAAGKAIQVAQAVMDTYVGANKALAQGGLFGAIGAAGIVAAGLANVRNIIQTDIPGETGGETSVPTPETGAGLGDTIPLIPTFGAIGAEAPPVQAFVVESDVSSSQALQQDLDLQATL